MNSPFKSYLYSNYVPSNDEVDQIQQLLRTVYDNELFSLDAEIHRLQLQLDELQARRDKLAEDMGAHKALISLIRRLPPEILQEIFIACLPDDRNPCITSSEAPVLLTRICSSWRKVALTTPGLWARIHIVLPTSLPLEQDSIATGAIGIENKIGQQETVVHEWLTRSGNCPLSISVYQAFRSTSYPSIFQELYRLSEGRHISFYKNVLIPHARRWYDIRLFTTFNTFKLVQSIPVSDLPMLRKLHVSSGWARQGSQQQYNANIWQNSLILQSPRLRALTLSFPFHALRTTDINLFLGRWPHLTELNLRIGEPSTTTVSSTNPNGTMIIHTILRLCPSLECLRLYIETLSFDRAPPPKPIKVRLPQLKVLGIITSGHFGNCMSVFNALDAPSLQHLELDYIPPWQGPVTIPIDSVCDILEDFLGTTGRNIHSWRMRPITGLQSSHLLRLLRLLPYLRELSFTSQQPQPLTQWYHPSVFFTQCPELNDELIHGLTPSNKNDDEVICPHLEVFKCISGISTKISEEAVINFVTSRRQMALIGAARRIRHVEVFVTDASDDGNTFKLPPYCEEGVTGGLVYKRRPARRIYSPYTGFSFSPEEIARQVNDFAQQ